jgi:hypothetical protein
MPLSSERTSMDFSYLPETEAAVPISSHPSVFCNLPNFLTEWNETSRLLKIARGAPLDS